MTIALYKIDSFLSIINVSSSESETYNFASQATETPIQNGAIVSNHVILKPVTIDAIFSSANTPNSGMAPKEIYDALFLAWQNRDMLTAFTAHARLENMVIVGFTPTHKAPFANALSCTLKLQQLKTPILSKTPYINALPVDAIPVIVRGPVAGTFTTTSDVLKKYGTGQ